MNTDQHIGAVALMLYLHNTSGVKFVEDIFGEVHETYMHEKSSQYATSPTRAIGHLDDDHRSKLVNIALDEHGAHAAQMVRFHS